MKVLSIKQPWASLIAHGIKDIENRTWKTNYRGRILIHASSTPVCKCQTIGRMKECGFTDDMILMAMDAGFSFNQALILTSAIIGEVDIIDCVINHPSIWAERSWLAKNQNESYVEEEDRKDFIVYNWVLANPVSYDEPILNVKGKLSFWEFNKQ